jgi:superfamily II DNA or RNA helicase
VNLCTEIEGRHMDRAFRGAALTYQQVLADPERYRRSLGRGWAVLDECHHAGEGKSWADALMHAFGDAGHRLSLSGTAFRSDACRIPFIRYGDDGVSVADYRYAYGDALRDGVVRPIFVVSFGGQASWYKGGMTRTAAFDQVVSREDSAARLRTALDPAGGWMRNALERAHQRLMDMRRSGHPDAGGLVVCMDQAHARRVADCLRSISGFPPAVALSDDPDASAVIARYRDGWDPWIVAVRQVSEGTDIPRLRVGVWATNASTELFFRQVVGRLVRMIDGLPDQDAFLYLPSDVLLLRHARALAEERAHHLPEAAADEDELAREQPPGGAESDFQPLGSTGSESEVVFGSRVLGPAELERARVVAEECGLQLGDPVAFAFALREAAGPGSDSSIPLEARRRALRSLLSRRVREYCARTGASHRDTYARLKGRAGRAVSRLNETALGRHVRTVEGWLEAEQRRAISAGSARP